MGLNSSFWQGKRVLVTGHTGFKGAWLSLWLQQLGAEVVGVSLDPPTEPNLYEQARVAKGMTSLRADIRDGARLKQIFAAHCPEIVFHLAAQSLVRYSYREPVETYETNVMGTLQVLEAIRATETVRAAVMVTSDKCYENREQDYAYREGDPMGGHDPYSSSKGAAELLIASYRNSYFPVERYPDHKTAIASVRAGNVIGGGDWAEDRLIPDLFNAHAAGKELVIRNPSAIRPWQFVLEPLHGYLTLAERLYNDGSSYAEAWNFGPREDDMLPVEDLVNRLSVCIEGGIRYRIKPESALHEAKLLKLDCSKALARLGWQPRTSIDDALRLIAEWQNNLHSGQDMRAVSLSQIRIFQSIT